MALVPDADDLLIEELLNTDTSDIVAPTKTYRLSFDNPTVVNQLLSELEGIPLLAMEGQPFKSFTRQVKRLTGLIDEEEALKQFIYKAFYTARTRYLIYTDQYGCELHDLLGEDFTDDYLNSEINRMIPETLMYDDRITDITDISFERIQDRVYISFRVVSIYGEFQQEVVI